VPAYTVNEDAVSREATTLAERTDFIDLHASALSDLADVLSLGQSGRRRQVRPSKTRFGSMRRGEMLWPRSTRAGALAELQEAT
jgi:hypothetical protein